MQLSRILRMTTIDRFFLSDLCVCVCTFMYFNKCIALRVACICKLVYIYTHIFKKVCMQSEMSTDNKHNHTVRYDRKEVRLARCVVMEIGLGTGTDNRACIFTGISPQNRYFVPVYQSTQCCSDLLSLSSYINGRNQEFDFYARFRVFLVVLPRAYWQEQ